MTPMPINASVIKVFLPSGSTDGVWIVERDNWNGLALAAPRSKYTELRDRPELDGPGVYVLTGEAEDAVFLSRIYIGEADVLRNRLDNHQRNKDEWNRVVIFATTNAFLNKANVRYLEARLVELARSGGRVELDNGNQPASQLQSESERASANNFLEQMLAIYPILGIDAFEVIPLSESISRGEAPLLYLSGLSAEGQGREVGDSFVVYKGARARGTVVDSYGGRATLRDGLIRKRILIHAGEDYSLADDCTFRSPSAAAYVLLGRPANGRIEWKDANGLTLKEIQEKSLSR